MAESYDSKEVSNQLLKMQPLKFSAFLRSK
jgi:hypothetical protein